MKLTKKLEQLRDELAHKFYDLDPKPDFPMGETQFAEGFDAAASAFLPAISGLMKALEFYDNKEHWSHDGLDPFCEEQGYLWENRFLPDNQQDYSNEVGTIMSSGAKARRELAEAKEKLGLE